MILFVPAYDDATQANLVLAKRLADVGSSVLFGDRATRDALLKLSVGGAEPLLVMTHGQPEFFRAEDKGSIGLNIDDRIWLARRSTFALACHTANGLGPGVAEHGGIWWGYTGAIQGPVCPEILVQHFVGIFQYIRGAFSGAHTPEQRLAVLLKIKELCNHANHQVDIHAEADPELDVAAANLCLLHLWDRLRIWAPGLSGPERHPHAQPPSLFLLQE